MSMLDDRLSNMVLTGQMTLDEALEESDDPSDLLRLCRLKKSAQYALRGYVALEYMRRELFSKGVLKSRLRLEEGRLMRSLIDLRNEADSTYRQIQKKISSIREKKEKAQPGLDEYARAQMEALTRDLDEQIAAAEKNYEKTKDYMNKQIDELSARMKDTRASLRSVLLDVARLRDSARNNAVAAIFSGFGEILQYVADTLLS